MKTTVNGYRLNRNGKVITSTEGEVVKDKFLGSSFKENGTYFFYCRKQSGKFIYTQ
jgi:hypothetical protein